MLPVHGFDPECNTWHFCMKSQCKMKAKHLGITTSHPQYTVVIWTNKQPPAIRGWTFAFLCKTKCSLDGLQLLTAQCKCLIDCGRAYCRDLSWIFLFTLCVCLARLSVCINHCLKERLTNDPAHLNIGMLQLSLSLCPEVVREPFVCSLCRTRPAFSAHCDVSSLHSHSQFPFNVSIKSQQQRKQRCLSAFVAKIVSVLTKQLIKAELCKFLTISELFLSFYGDSTDMPPV